MEEENKTILVKFKIIIYMIWILGFFLISIIACNCILTNLYPIPIVIISSIIAIFLIWLSTTLLEGFSCIIKLLMEIKNKKDF